MIFDKVLTLFDGKKKRIDIWDVLLFFRRTFTADEDINIPADKVLILKCPSLDGELTVDGELYLL